MQQIITQYPGRQVTVFLEVKDGYGQPADAPILPMVYRIILPSFNTAIGYPQNMTRLDVGLYSFQFILPVGAVAMGSYLVDVSYTNPITNLTNYQTYQVVVVSPFGNYGTGSVG